MGAFAERVFDKGFLLDEERIRKLNAMLMTRGQHLAEECKPTYRVYRADTYTYTTEDIQEVIDEDNVSWQRIVEFDALLDAGSDLSLQLQFRQEGPPTLLLIEGEDRDNVFLLFSELRQYLTNEVNTIQPLAKRIYRGILVVLGIMLVASAAYALFGLDVYFRGRVPDRLSVEAALASQDIAEKLNFLIEYQATPLPSIVRYYAPGLCIFIAAAITGTSSRWWTGLIEHIFPSNIFLLGKELERNARRQSVRHNILWGIVISFVIGVLGGLVVWMLTGQ
jgi:hypothetical protein